jgi:hypothetical protein
MTKQTPPPAAQSQSDSTLAIISMVFGVMSLTGPGLLLGIPAIIIAIIALKKNKGSRGLSITGIVTGIVSTVASILFIVFMGFLINWSINHPEEFNQEKGLPEQFEQESPYSNSRI